MLGGKIRGFDSNRHPDIQVVDKRTGKAVQVTEIERDPTSKRNRDREAEYNELGIPNDTFGVGKGKSDPGNNGSPKEDSED